MAKTQYAILPEIRKRWSPYGFANKPVPAAKLKQLFEAMAWTSSSYNEQPWRILMGTKEEPDTWGQILTCFSEWNQKWARFAPVLMILVGKEQFSDSGTPNRCFAYDCGAAVAQLSLEAVRHELYLHQVAGIDLSRVRKRFSLPSGFVPLVGLALGYYDPHPLGADPEVMLREQFNRQRKAAPEFVFAGQFGEAHPLFQFP